MPFERVYSGTIYLRIKSRDLIRAGVAHRNFWRYLSRDTKCIIAIFARGRACLRYTGLRASLALTNQRIPAVIIRGYWGASGALRVQGVLLYAPRGTVLSNSKTLYIVPVITTGDDTGDTNDTNDTNTTVTVKVGVIWHAHESYFFRLFILRHYIRKSVSKFDGKNIGGKFWRLIWGGRKS